jgi:hypothetical protein
MFCPVLAGRLQHGAFTADTVQFQLKSGTLCTYTDVRIHTDVLYIHGIILYYQWLSYTEISFKVFSSYN